MKFSCSQIELYNECARKYKYKYIDGWEPDKTFSPLLFGRALDTALNYILKQKKEGKKIELKKAIFIFNKSMNEWTAHNEFVFFKSEVEPEDIIKDDKDGNQLRAWSRLVKSGHEMLKIYLKEVMPLIEQVYYVQEKKTILNEEDDQFTLVLDTIVKLKDGRVVLLDHKTASKPYPEDSAKTSRQLALYNEFYKCPYVGYIVFQKRLIDNKVKWDMIVDKMDDVVVSGAWEKVDETIQKIKGSIIEDNWPCDPGCKFKFGKPCPYLQLCSYGSTRGLIKRKEE